MFMLSDLSIKKWSEATADVLFRDWENAQWHEWRTSVYGPDYGKIKGVYTNPDPVAALALAYEYPHAGTAKRLRERISQRREEFVVEVEALIPELEEAAKKFRESIREAINNV